jgi:hypothetical protein
MEKAVLVEDDNATVRREICKTLLRETRCEIKQARAVCKLRPRSGELRHSDRLAEDRRDKSV